MTAVLTESRCGLLLSIHTVHKYLFWCRGLLQALLLPRNPNSALQTCAAVLCLLCLAWDGEGCVWERVLSV